jgi:hypothetical protein
MPSLVNNDSLKYCARYIDILHVNNAIYLKWVNMPGNDSVIETRKTSRVSGGFRVLGPILSARNDVLLADGCVPGGNLNSPEPPSGKVNPPPQI